MSKRDYTEQRICTIDYYPLLEGALKDLLLLCKKHNIQTTRSNSKDFTKLFYHYCLERFIGGYTKCQSKYPKVLVIYPKPGRGPLQTFTSNGLERVLKVLPIPWCKCKSFDSPDTVIAALGRLSTQKPNTQKLNKFAKTHELISFLKRSKRFKAFPTGSIESNEEIVDQLH
jgi:hypothetical protein